MSFKKLARSLPPTSHELAMRGGLVDKYENRVIAARLIIAQLMINLVQCERSVPA